MLIKLLLFILALISGLIVVAGLILGFVTSVVFIPIVFGWEFSRWSSDEALNRIKKGYYAKETKSGTIQYSGD